MSQLQQTRSQEMFQKASAVFPGGVNSPVRAFKSVGRNPFFVARGEGAYLEDVDGNRYIDYINSWGPLVLGHAHPAVASAIKSQVERGLSYGACSEHATRLAELVQRLFPSMEMLRFVNSGTEAGMSVIRLARGYTKRNKIVKFTGNYHGHVDSLLVEAGSGIATLGIPSCAGVPESFVRDTLAIPYNDVEALRQVFSANRGEIAAVIMEPIAGNAGFIVPEDEFIREARDLTTKNGSLLIFDEVMCGFRVALGGAQEYFGVTPDLTMLGKVIGGGMPVGAFGGRRDIMEKLAPLGPVYQAGTLSGNPLAMVAGYATLSAWMEPGVFEGVATQAARLAEAFVNAGEQAGIPVQSRSVGSMFGFFFSEEPVDSFEAAKRCDLERFQLFFNAALERGVYFAPSSFEAGFVSSAHSEAVVSATINVIEDVFSRVLTA